MQPGSFTPSLSYDGPYANIHKQIGTWQIDVCRSIFHCTLPSLTRQGTVATCLYYGTPNDSFYDPTMAVADPSTFLNDPCGRLYYVNTNPLCPLGAFTP